MNIKRLPNKLRQVKTKVNKLNGGVSMRRLNINKLKNEKNFVTISSQEALKEITPINWSQSVTSNVTKIEVKDVKTVRN